MIFNYSLCYPDKQKIDYFRDEVNASYIAEVFKSFNWDQELKKPIKYYNPSIEINRLSDKVKLILTAVGNVQLDKFIVMLFIPKADTIGNEFDREAFKNSKCHEEYLSVDKSQLILNEFLAYKSPELIRQLLSSINESKAIQFSLSQLQFWMARIGGILLVGLLAFVLFIMARDQFGFWPIATIGSLMILFLISTIKL